MPPREREAADLSGEQQLRVRTLGHLSDLHLGSGRAADDAALALARALEAGQLDQVVLTGDVTHRGRRSELARFREVFGKLLAGGSLAVIPGNHDRMTDDVGRLLMPGERVQRRSLPGLWLVLLDSTATYNRRLHLGHGELSQGDLDALDRALGDAPAGVLRAVALHHHPLPLPSEDLGEVLTSWLRLPWCAELRAGLLLLEVLRGRCDLLLHGHRHVPSEQSAFEREAVPLRIFNAGSSSREGRFRVFRHRAGALTEAPAWAQSSPGPAAGAPLAYSSSLR